MPTETAALPIADTQELGTLGILHVKRLWSRTLASQVQSGQVKTQTDDWVKDNTLICGLGLGLRETMQCLHERRPSLEQFEHWILEINGATISRERIERLNAALSGEWKTGPAPSPEDKVFTADDISFWDENGYVVLHDAVAPENCRAAREAICQFLKMKMEDSNTWYGPKQGHSIWIPLLHHPTLDANRRSLRIHKAFAQLWGRTDLWITTDQSGMNPPEREGWKFPGPNLHWDVSIALPIPFGVQGILYLADTAAEQGAFCCVPGFHKKIEAWLQSLPANTDPRSVDLSKEAVPIAGKAGDLIIWHHSLPHGSSPNRAQLPRFVQYMTMRPSYWEMNPVWR